MVLSITMRALLTKPLTYALSRVLKAFSLPARPVQCCADHAIAQVHVLTVERVDEVGMKGLACPLVACFRAIGCAETSRQRWLPVRPLAPDVQRPGSP